MKMSTGFAKFLLPSNNSSFKPPFVQLSANSTIQKKPEKDRKQVATHNLNSNRKPSDTEAIGDYPTSCTRQHLILCSQPLSMSKSIFS